MNLFVALKFIPPVREFNTRLNWHFFSPISKRLEDQISIVFMFFLSYLGNNQFKFYPLKYENWRRFLLLVSTDLFTIRSYSYEEMMELNLQSRERRSIYVFVALAYSAILACVVDLSILF